MYFLFILYIFLWLKEKKLKFPFLFVQKYHPSRVLTLVYQPFAVGTLAILTYYEAKINTRKRILFGYTLFFLAVLAVLIVNPDNFFVNFDSFKMCIWVLNFDLY